ncbi:MAG: hypothetical protein JWR52_1779 [Marmoricola sp.]|nr:hypothetical protein [Marmoricola sp.]
MLIFASLTDRTVEEIVVTVELHEKEGLWSIDVIDREALPLVEPAEMQSGGNEHLQSVGLLAEAVARLEGRIVETLKDLRHEF